MNLITSKTARDEYLRQKNRFYIAGWLDAERNEPAQASTRENDEELYNDYMNGYKESMANQFALESV